MNECSKSRGISYIEVVLGPIKTTTNKHKYRGISYFEIVVGPIKPNYKQTQSLVV